MNLNFTKLFQDKEEIKKISGNFFDEMDEKIRLLRKKGVEIIDFGVGDPTKTFGTPDFIINETIKALEVRKYDGYPGNKGTENFRNAVSSYLKDEFSVEVNPKNQVNITNGSKTAACILPQLFITPGDIVIIPNPGYPGFEKGTLLANGIPYFVPLREENDFLIDFKSIPHEVAKKAKLIWINYPNSPTGKLAPKAWLESLIDWCHTNEIILASDEAYIDIYYNEKPISPLGITKEGVISFYSFSKRNNMTGYRIGFAAGDSRIIEKFYQLKNMHDDGVPYFIQDAAIKALKERDYLISLREKYLEKRNLIIEAMGKLGSEKQKHSNGSIFLLMKSPNGMNGEDFALELINKGIAVIPGNSFVKHVENEVSPMENVVRFALMPLTKDIRRIMSKF